MIIGLVGLINSGKGTVAGNLVSKYNFRQDSFASSLKDACCAIFDWPRDLLEGDTQISRDWREGIDEWWANELSIPAFTPRLALQLIGTDVLRNNFNQDMWFLTLKNRIRKNPAQNVVISDVRFPNEIKFIKDQGGKLIRINRGPLPPWYETALLANNGNSIAKSIMEQTYPAAHQSEWAWVGSDIDYQINNDGTVDDLTKNIDDVLATIL